MRDVPLMVEMTRRIVEAVKVPVTVKTRLGWDEEHRNIEEIALRLQDAASPRSPSTAARGPRCTRGRRTGR